MQKAADTPSTASPGRRRTLLVLVLAGVLFFHNLGAYDLWPPDEPRFGEVAREMLESGDPLVLRVNGEFYKEKPPLLFWLVSLVSLPFSEVRADTARIPSAAAGLAVVALTMLLARRLWGPRVALWSGLVLATSALFWWEARSVRTDMLLTAFTTAALFSFWRWHESRRAPWRAAFFLAVAAALLAKGPPGLVFPLLLVYTFYWGRRDERRALHFLPGLILAALPVLAWFVLANLWRGDVPVPADEAAEAGMASNLFRQTVGRFFLGVSKAEWPWYYVVDVIPSGLLPWTLFLPWTLLWVWRRRHEGPAMRLLLSWTIPAFLFFTLSIGKRPVYILPLFPVFAILIARSAIELAESPHHVRWRRNTALVWAVLLALLALVPVGLRYSEYRDSWTPGLMAITVAGLVFAAHALHNGLRNQGRTLHRAMALHFAVLAVLATTLAFPVLDAHKSARPFTAPLRELSRQGVEYRLYSVGFSREEYVFYAEHTHVPVLTNLLPMDLEDDLDFGDMARLQRRLNKAIAEAVEDVPVADFSAVTPEEIAALRRAVDAALAEAEVNPAQAQAFEKALSAEVHRFAEEFDGPGPAFFFVEEQDWRWLLALYPHLAGDTVVAHRPVGSREVLLVANADGVRALNRAGNESAGGRTGQ